MSDLNFDGSMAMLGAKVSARDAEIAALKAELADAQQDVATLLTTVEQQRQYIERLKAQVAELQATVSNAPLEALRRYYHGTTKVSALIDSVYSEEEYLEDSDMIERWFRDMD